MSSTSVRGSCPCPTSTLLSSDMTNVPSVPKISNFHPVACRAAVTKPTEKVPPSLNVPVEGNRKVKPLLTLSKEMIYGSDIVTFMHELSVIAIS
ncbi:hypothetical protein [Salipaludibacillus daqingensis]|uniref:hypothetical protein n=1 Tax=Salipaludibacillus daqingensis TaxID=3041001 RepID=UPI002475F5E3|nr:hypothetical protein [Salipaludibacillus daqingensis]